MANVLGGFQPDTKAPSSRRADFDLQRRIATLEAATVADAEDPDATWTSLPLLSGWNGGWAYAHLRKIGDMVQLRAYVSFGGGVGNPMAILPVGFRPPNHTYVAMSSVEETPRLLRLLIRADGPLEVYGLVAANEFGFECQFSVTPGPPAATLLPGPSP